MCSSVASHFASVTHMTYLDKHNDSGERYWQTCQNENMLRYSNIYGVIMSSKK